MFLSETSVLDCVAWVLRRCRYMFYLVTPSETMYPDVHFVPRLVVEVSPLCASRHETPSLPLTVCARCFPSSSSSRFWRTDSVS